MSTRPLVNASLAPLAAAAQPATRAADTHAASSKSRSWPVAVVRDFREEPPEPWGEEHSALLQLMMSDQGLRREQLAHLSALSKEQVVELLQGRAQGLSSCFYSAQIKRHAGNKVLALLTERLLSGTLQPSEGSSTGISTTSRFTPLAANAS